MISDDMDERVKGGEVARLCPMTPTVSPLHRHLVTLDAPTLRTAHSTLRTSLTFVSHFSNRHIAVQAAQICTRVHASLALQDAENL